VRVEVNFFIIFIVSLELTKDIEIGGMHFKGMWPGNKKERNIRTYSKN
jgi:hypothetical protein